MLESIGNRINEAIVNSGLTKTFIADECGVSKQAITGWINKNSIDKTNLMKVSKLTKCRYEWLLTGEGEKSTINYNQRVENGDSFVVAEQTSEDDKQSMHIVTNDQNANFEIDHQRLMLALEIIKEDTKDDWCRKPILNQSRIIMMAYDRAGQELKEK